MNSIAPQLPVVFGSFAAMLVAFLSLLNGTSPSTCMMKAAAAFLVFAGFGLILRFALTESLLPQSKAENEFPGRARMSDGRGLDVIVPGTSVADLLASTETDAVVNRNDAEVRESEEQSLV